MTRNTEYPTVTGEFKDLARLETELQLLGQSRLLRELQSSTGELRQQLITQLLSIDFSLLREIRQTGLSNTAADRAQRAAAPTTVVRQPQSPEHHQLWQNARSHGEELLRNGAAAVVTVAGGQGTRLGFDLPKGMFPIGPLSSRTLFQIFAEQILARRRRYAAPLPWLIMTSDATHTQTASFFEANAFFGLGADSVFFFRQGSLPALDAATGEILLSAPGELALSPDGHGGLVGALEKSGLLNWLQQHGIRHLYYHQVDNPTAIVADPALLGFHSQARAQATTCVVCRTSPAERMGVVVDLEGRSEIIEYSELTPEQSAARNPAGEWIFWAGNTAIHVFELDFLKQLTTAGSRLPLHAARKNVPFIDLHGQLQTPSDHANPNAIKLEQFIFDALPMAHTTLIVEGHREREFNPVKNRSGSDSVDTCRAALLRIAREWLEDAGCQLPDNTHAEISPLHALDPAELKQRLHSSQLTINDLVPSSPAPPTSETSRE